MIHLVFFIAAVFFGAFGAAFAAQPAPNQPTPNQITSGEGDASASRTNFAMVEDGVARKTVGDFCYHWRSDRYCAKN